MVISLQVEDSTKALEATNGTTLEKNGQILRVAYAKSILGPGSGSSGASQSSSLAAAAAIEAATFAQQVIVLAFLSYSLSTFCVSERGGEGKDIPWDDR